MTRSSDALKQRFDSPEFTRALEDIYNGPSAPPLDDSENTYPEPQWSQIRANEDAIALLSYLKRNGHRKTDVNALRKNWGKRQDVHSRDDIRSLLLELNAAHIGEWLDDAATRWRVLPEWGDFPEWIPE